MIDWITDGARIPLGTWVKELINFLKEYLGWLFDAISMVLTGVYDVAVWVFTAPPAWALIIVLAGIAYLAKGWKLAVGTVLGLLLIITVNQWQNAMLTLALTIVAVLIATLIAIPLGIWAARSQAVSNVVRPILDFLQTMPAFVYLLPAIFLFSVGVVPGIVATILFAIAPGVRLTELGIRGVDREVVEAGNAFGATPGRILRQIQLPLAMPSIMAGVNQVIMLSLSMSVIASMVGAPGLGKPIVQALSSVNIPLGFEAGAAVVVIAMILDRVTGGFGQSRRARRRTAPAGAPAPAAAV
ncbi:MULTISPECIES: proline/glycine betaine ABC transporter permease [Microbacterium]|uniref:ABC transporter permease n=1 Tax=Microbacterium TaxID=33882 RepID=UPI001E62BF61|nr:proline/glycine betaine ABC transporter permease [Microbacterium nymphoidis]MCD2498014.1 proline/glycine betaine ABC transporter permease [Microbacterium nymphoidis]